MESVADNTSVSLKFVVVGGGISGLATSYALARAGHKVILLEKSDGTESSAVGVRSPPSMTRVLHQWGLKHIFDEIAQLCRGISWYSGPNAEPLGSLVVDDFLKEVAANFYFIQHGTLQDLLERLAKQEGVDIRYNTRVLGADPDTGYVSLNDGGQIYGDVVIAADGYNSALRAIVVGEEDKPNPEKTLILSFALPTAVLEGDPELRSMLVPTLSSFWIGEGYFCVSHMLNKGRDYTGIISHKYSGPQEVNDWTLVHDINQFDIDFGKLDTRVKKLLAHATSVYSRIIHTKSSVDSLVCENSRIVLVGDAAHPIPHGANHCQALGFEDAQTLGCLFSRLQRRDQVSQLLTAYNEIRQPWSHFALAHTYRHHQMLKMPNGPGQQMRDARMRATMVHLDVEDDHMDEVMFKQVWGDDLRLFLYDAREKVEDWWGQWGASIVKGPNRTSVLPRVQISVSTKTE
ncbi:hypothetical protein CVT25_005149 [Psilocybe cyanescens]|uniref:FAD-binding domain-containing protein n=1 Tax=Psilocybe cyanescens TaxID=93625 RepID=A0A409XBS7_PSICY|nr:hypothetical protein CVT25_005149 [Psilocybe cyanescens]